MGSVLLSLRPLRAHKEAFRGAGKTFIHKTREHQIVFPAHHISPSQPSYWDILVGRSSEGWDYTLARAARSRGWFLDRRKEQPLSRLMCNPSSATSPSPSAHQQLPGEAPNPSRAQAGLRSPAGDTEWAGGKPVMGRDGPAPGIRGEGNLEHFAPRSS